MDQYDEDDLEIDLGFDALDGGDEAAGATASDAQPAASTSMQVDGDASQQQEQQQPQQQQPEHSQTPAPAAGVKLEGGPEPDTKALALVPPGDQQGGAALSREGFGCVVYVNGMDWWVTDVDVEEACQEFGTVVSQKFFEDRSNGKSAGSCAVEFKSNAEAAACIQKLHMAKIGGKEVHVSWPGKGRFFKPRPPLDGDMMGRGRGRGFMGMDVPMGPRMPMPGMMPGMMDPMAMAMHGMMGPPMGMMGPPMMRPGMGMGPMRPGMGMGMGMGMDAMDRKRHRT